MDHSMKYVSQTEVKGKMHFWDTMTYYKVVWLLRDAVC